MGRGMSGPRHGALQHPSAVGAKAGGSKKGLLGNLQLHVKVSFPCLPAAGLNFPPAAFFPTVGDW